MDNSTTTLIDIAALLVAGAALVLTTWQAGGFTPPGSKVKIPSKRYPFLGVCVFILGIATGAFLYVASGEIAAGLLGGLLISLLAGIGILGAIATQ